MSDKHASAKVEKPNFDSIADKEMESASSALFDDLTKGAKQFFRGTLNLAEQTHDKSAAFLAVFGAGEHAAEDHTSRLEREAAQALKKGDYASAKHYLKRDIAFTSFTQSLDDEDTQRLMKELTTVQKLETLQNKELAEQKAHRKPSKTASASHLLADLMLTGS